MSDGIRRRHTTGCPALGGQGSRCSCSAGWEAAVYDDRGVKVRRSFPSRSAATAWRGEVLQARRLGGFHAPDATTVTEAAEALLAGMEAGTVRTRSGDIYKPSVLRGYGQALRLRVLPEIGGLRLGDIRRRDLQRLVDRMLADGATASTVRNTINPVRVLFRRALEDGDVLHNPCANLRLPAVRGRRERVASVDEAATLLAAIPELRDRAVYATACYAGLRLGELRALRWDDVNLGAGTISVERSLDQGGQIVAPKSRAGTRTVPIVGALRDILLDHKVDSGGTGLAFANSGDGRPFTASTLYDRARAAWRVAGLDPIGLHEARHTFASMSLAAGVSLYELSRYMGHSGIQVTADRYGHLLPGAHDESRRLLDSYLDRASTQARIATVDGDS